MKTAIIYGSGFTGHTRKIAENLANRIGADVFNVKKLNDFKFEEYDRIVLGTNVHFGKPNGRVLGFEVENSDKVACKSPALFIVCSFKDEKGGEQAKRIAAEFNIENYAYFPSGEKDANGMPLKLDEFASKL